MAQLSKNFKFKEKQIVLQKLSYSFQENSFVTLSAELLLGRFEIAPEWVALEIAGDKLKHLKRVTGDYNDIVQILPSTSVKKAATSPLGHSFIDFQWISRFPAKTGVV